MRCCLIFALALWAAEPSVYAQSDNSLARSLSGSFALPIDLNILQERSGEISSGFFAPAVSGEVTLPISSRVSLHTLFEFPWSYETQDRHQGGGGYTADIRHQDIVAGELVGLRIPSKVQTEVAALVGFGLVFARTVETVQYGINSIGRGAIERRSQINVDPSVIGGIRASTPLNGRTSVTIRVLARATRRTAFARDQDFAWLTITPSVGLQFALSGR
jgi:hypothetical protein